MSRAMVVLDTEFQRQKAADWCWAAKQGSRVEFKGPKRSLDQNSLMWVLLTEIAVHMRKTAGLDYSTEEWKHIFLHGWGREVRFLPALDGKGVVPIPQSSSDLSKEEMTDFIEYILKEGAERGVQFDDHSSSAAPQAEDEGSGEESPSPSAESLEAGIEAAAEPTAPASGEPDERAWLVSAAKMLVAATAPGGDPDVVRNQYAGILKGMTPKGISQAAIAKANSIGKRLVAVCEQTEELDLDLIAGLAGCDAKDLR